jgi:hypothetical protein
MRGSGFKEITSVSAAIDVISLPIVQHVAGCFLPATIPLQNHNNIAV